jgi:antitoxin (DNA-binding transcriptional repressor) of toxin-antitoxin stability system
MSAVTASQLRQDVYRLLDHVLETGEPLEIRRKGKILRVVPDSPPTRLDLIRPNLELIVGDPEELVEPTPYEWDPDRVLEP